MTKKPVSVTRASILPECTRYASKRAHSSWLPWKLNLVKRQRVVFEESHHTPWDFILSNLLFYSFCSLRPVIQHLFLALALVVDKEIRKNFHLICVTPCNLWIGVQCAYCLMLYNLKISWFALKTPRIRDYTLYPGLTRARCIRFLLIKFIHVLVYNSTIFELTAFSFLTVLFETIPCRKKYKGEKTEKYV